MRRASRAGIVLVAVGAAVASRGQLPRGSAARRRGRIADGAECLDELMQPAAHLHRTIEVVGVGTGIADPIPGGCGHGRVVEGVPGCLPENPIVPNCQ